MGGIVAWIGLELTYFLLLKASELFAEDEGSVHAVYDLRGGDVVFYESEREVEEGSSPELDTVEVRFRGSKCYKRSTRGGTGGDKRLLKHGGRNSGADTGAVPNA